MKTKKVYDLPTRIFHWLFVGLFVSAFFIAKTIENDTALFLYHMLLGITLAVVTLLRIVWGFVGSRYAKFSSYRLNPIELIYYFKGLVSGKTERTLGHNPASSWSALLMMALALGLSLTGFLMIQGVNKETIEEIHEPLANGFLLVAMAHVAGLLVHMIRHRDWIATSMIHGRKKDIEGELEINHSYRSVAAFYIVIIASFVFYLSQNYDAQLQQLNLFGKVLQLGETEEVPTDDTE